MNQMKIFGSHDKRSKESVNIRTNSGERNERDNLENDKINLFITKSIFNDYQM